MTVILQIQGFARPFEVFKYPFFLGSANALFYYPVESCKHCSMLDWGFRISELGKRKKPKFLDHIVTARTG